VSLELQAQTKMMTIEKSRLERKKCIRLTGIILVNFQRQQATFAVAYPFAKNNQFECYTIK
jgi:hypothetical protein